MPETLLRFVQISDTHISHDPHYNKDGAQHTPLMGARALVHQLKLLPFTPDFVLHTGDVAYDPVEDAYPAAREVLSEIDVPVYYLAGNHDNAALLQKGMLDSTEILTPFDYEFEVNGVQIVCMDSNRDAPDWKGAVSAEQLAWLAERCNAQDERPLIVALHHPVLEMGAPFWDEKMCLVDGEKFHQALLPARDRLRAQLEAGEAAYAHLFASLNPNEISDLKEKEIQRLAALAILDDTSALSDAALQMRFAARNLERNFEQLYDNLLTEYEEE